MKLAKGWTAGILAVILNACITPTQPNTPTVTATIGGSGGRIEATSNGAVVALEFPAGAVKQNLEVKLTPLAPNTETLAGFRVEPGGTFLHQAVALKFRSSNLPAGASFFWKFGASRRAFPTTRSGDTLNAQIRSLGYQPQQGVRSLAEGDGNLEVGVLDCGQRIPELQQQLRAVVNSGDFAQATVFLDEVEAVVFACELQEIAALQQAACQEYAGAEQTVQVVAADTYEKLRQLLVLLLAGETSVRLTGVECDTSGFSSLFDAKLNQFLDFLEADFSRPSFAQEFNQAAVRVKELLRYEAYCQAMTDSGPVCARFSNQLFPLMLDKLRLAAYRICRQGDLLTLSQMYSHILPRMVIGQQLRAQTVPADPYLTYANYTYGDLEVDLAHCKSNLNVKVYDNATTLPEEITDQQRELVSGDQPASHTTSATVQVPPDGSLILEGTVKALVCPDASLSDDALVFRVGNTVVAQRPRNGDRFSLDTAPADLVVERVLSAAGLPPTTNSFAVEVFREGAACRALFRGALKLYTINVQVGCQAPVITTASLPGAQIGQPYAATLQATGGQPPLQWSATGLPGGLVMDAASGEIRGTPTDEGTFEVRVGVQGSSCPSAERTLTLTVASDVHPMAGVWRGIVEVAGSRVVTGPGYSEVTNVSAKFVIRFNVNAHGAATYVIESTSGSGTTVRNSGGSISTTVSCEPPDKQNIHPSRLSNGFGVSGIIVMGGVIVGNSGLDCSRGSTTYVSSGFEVFSISAPRTSPSAAAGSSSYTVDRSNPALGVSDIYTWQLAAGFTR